MLLNPLVPDSFNVPEQKETSDFQLRMLTVHDIVKDYDAVMSSVGRLTTVFGDNSGWPRGLTLEQNLIDLGWHQKEFQRRTSFAYTVMKPDETMCLGCVYILPPTRNNTIHNSTSDNSGFDAAVFLWVRDSAYAEGLDEKLFAVVKQWIEEEWPFRAVAYPGREIAWGDW